MHFERRHTPNADSVRRKGLLTMQDLQVIAGAISSTMFILGTLPVLLKA